MKVRPTLFVTLFTPVLVFAAIVAGVYVTSLRDIQSARHADHDLTAWYATIVTRTIRLNEALGAVQHDLQLALGFPATRPVDAATTARVRTALLDRLTRVESGLRTLIADPLFQRVVPDEGRDALADIARYRAGITAALGTDATDVAAIDRGIHLAAASHIAFLEHTDHIASRISGLCTARSNAMRDRIDGLLRRTTVTTIVLTAALLALWFAIARYLTQRLGTLDRALRTLAATTAGAEPPQLPEVERIGRDERTAFGNMATSVLAFREAITARRTVLHALVYGSPDPVWLKDPDGIYLACNPRFAQICHTIAGLRMRADVVPAGDAAIGTVIEADRSGDPYRLVLLEWRMPAMDGVETARRLRQAPLRQRPALVLVSAVPDVPMAQIRATGFDGYSRSRSRRPASAACLAACSDTTPPSRNPRHSIRWANWTGGAACAS